MAGHMALDGCITFYQVGIALIDWLSSQHKGLCTIAK